MKIRILFCAFVFSLLASGCNLYKLSYEKSFSQGNNFSENEISQLRIGMSKEEVTTILGTPVLNNVFTDKHMHYVYYLHKDHRIRNLKRLDLTFENGKLSEIQSS